MGEELKEKYLKYINMYESYIMKTRELPVIDKDFTGLATKEELNILYKIKDSYFKLAKSIYFEIKDEDYTHIDILKTILDDLYKIEDELIDFPSIEENVKQLKKSKEI